MLHTDFVAHYGILQDDIDVDRQIVKVAEFSLEDMPSPFHILPFHEGTLSFKRNTGDIEVIKYEHLIDYVKNPPSFSRGRKKCDYVICSTESGAGASHIILAELTSALGSDENLMKPIPGKRGKVLYEGGKYEKAAIQLSESLATLMAVPSIRSYFGNMDDKQCIIAYKIIPYKDPEKRRLHPMNRYLEIESAETHGNGAEIPNVTIKSYGFILRRMRNTAAYDLSAV